MGPQNPAPRGNYCSAFGSAGTKSKRGWELCRTASPSFATIEIANLDVRCRRQCRAEIAPDVLLLEIASALWKRVVLRKELTSDEATLIYRDLLTMPISLIPAERLAEPVLQLAMKYKHPVYDPLYSALAIDRQCDFVTADQTMVNKFRKDFPFVRHLSTITP